MLCSVHNWQWYSAIFCRVFNIHLISIIWRKKSPELLSEPNLCLFWNAGIKDVHKRWKWHLANVKWCSTVTRQWWQSQRGNFNWVEHLQHILLQSSIQINSSKKPCNNKCVKHVFSVKCVVSMLFSWVCAFNFVIMSMFSPLFRLSMISICYAHLLFIVLLFVLLFSFCFVI